MQLVAFEYRRKKFLVNLHASHLQWAISFELWWFDASSNPVFFNFCSFKFQVRHALKSEDVYHLLRVYIFTMDRLHFQWTWKWISLSLQLSGVSLKMIHWQRRVMLVQISSVCFMSQNMIVLLYLLPAGQLLIVRTLIGFTAYLNILQIIKLLFLIHETYKEGICGDWQRTISLDKMCFM